MVEAVEEDSRPVVTGEDGKNALALVLGLYESSEQKTPVKVEE